MRNPLYTNHISLCTAGVRFPYFLVAVSMTRYKCFLAKYLISYMRYDTRNAPVHLMPVPNFFSSDRNDQRMMTNFPADHSPPSAHDSSLLISYILHLLPASFFPRHLYCCKMRLFSFSSAPFIFQFILQLLVDIFLFYFYIRPIIVACFFAYI